MNIAKMMSEKPWRSSWPASIVEEGSEALLPDVPWKGQIARYRKIFQALDGKEGASCSVSDARELLQRMEQWSERHAAYFSWPPTQDGWARAVWATMEEPQGKEDMAWLWAVYGPSVRLAMSEKPAPQAWAVSLLRSIAPDPAPAVAPAVPPPAGAGKDAPPAEPKLAAKEAPAKERELSPEVRRTREWIERLLSDLSTSKEPDGVISEKFDRAVKEAIETHAHEGANRIAGWIEYTFLPAIVSLDAGKMSMLADLWPASQSRSFIDPQKTVSSKRFWAVLEEPTEDARAVLVGRILPTIIDASEWSSSQRYAMAVEMLSWTKRRPAVFRERLRLWQSWGGRLDDAEAPPAPDGNMFSKAKMAPETVEAWIRKQDIAEWSAAISQPRSQRRP